MTAKKSIFEKLRLIEAVEEPDQGKKESVDEPFFLNPNDEDIQAEFEEMLSGDIMETYEEAIPDEFDSQEHESMKSEVAHHEEPVVEVAPMHARESAMSEVQNEAAAFVIEDKLNTLIEAYEKNKLLTIDEIYRNARLTLDNKRSIFIADIFLKTLPENLPVDIKRTSLLNILNVSSINIEELLTDAFQRIDSLNTVLENTVNTTDDIMKKNETSIRELENRIEELKNVMEARRKFQEDQNTLIEYEIQRIINIVDFIKPKK